MENQSYYLFVFFRFCSTVPIFRNGRSNFCSAVGFNDAGWLIAVRNVRQDTMIGGDDRLNRRPIKPKSPVKPGVIMKVWSDLTETIAIHFAINVLRPYLYGTEFTVNSDHKPLLFLYKMENPSSKLVRIRLELEEYNFNIVYLE